MTTVTRLRRTAGPTTLAEASRRFLRREAFEPTTRDAYGLYERFGFSKPRERYMERPAVR